MADEQDPQKLADNAIAEAMRFADQVAAEAEQFAPTIAIHSPARHHIDRALLAIWGLQRAIGALPPPQD